MLLRRPYFLALFLLMTAAAFVPGVPATAQEVLQASRIQAKASRRQPALGLPKRLDGQLDAAIWYDTGVWKGADSRKAQPLWSMTEVMESAGKGPLAAVFKLCVSWASERPKRAVDVVCGPFRDGWYVALCKKTHGDLGWKSIGFVLPADAAVGEENLWDYSHSINWLEHQISYNLFPKLPAHLQEIIEEMTSAEHLCPISEFDPGMDEGPDREVDYDMEEDYREMI